MIKKLFTTLNISALFLLAQNKVQAAISNPAIGDLGTTEGAADGSKFISYTVYLWRVAINIGALAVIFFFILGAFEWITAGSDTKKVESARNKIMNAVIGLVILVGSFTIISFLSKILFGGSFDILKLSFPNYLGK